MTNRYRPDHKGMGVLMRTSAALGVMLIDVAVDEALPFAKAISPDAPPYGEGYVDNFEINHHVELVAGHRRQVVDVVNTSRYAAAVEWGWDEDHQQFADHRGYHVLGITADVIESGSR